jgi:flagella basal body P-ring formation protein FlgA
MRILAALLLLAAPAMAQEFAAARPLATVEEPTLRLSDIFEGAGPRAGLSIGASPAPGRRLVLEVPQLLAIARLHGLGWRPASPHERVVVERPGRPVPREEVEAVLRDELRRLGMEHDAELDLGALLLPLVPPAAPAQLSTEGVSFDPASGRFGATLVVMADGMAVQRLRLSGRATSTLLVMVAARRLAIGEVIGPRDVRMQRLRADRVRVGTAERPDQVIGLQLHRPLAAEAPVFTADLGPPAVVERNALVTMLLEAPGLSLSAQGRALEAAPRGGLVPVMNLASRTVVEGEVMGPGRVRVAMGATPLRR